MLIYKNCLFYGDAGGINGHSTGFSLFVISSLFLMLPLCQMSIKSLRGSINILGCLYKDLGAA